MTQTHTSGQPAKQAQTPQQSHLKAAEHHDQASIHHKEAAKHLAAGDQNAAVRCAKLANEHTALATKQCQDACKESAMATSQKH